jgi:hypothetical protein
MIRRWTGRALTWGIGRSNPMTHAASVGAADFSEWLRILESSLDSPLEIVCHLIDTDRI